jgi:hypothetical protein
MADISWVEGEGSEAEAMSLGSPRPDPANRFFDVVPDYQHIGPIKTALDRSIHAFTFREDYTVSVTIRHLSPTQLETALLLKAHLMTGGLVDLNTDDVDSATYEDIQLAPGTVPEIRNDDDERQHFSFSCVLADDSPITVNYDG